MQSDQPSTRLLQQRPMTEPVEALYTVPPSSAAIAAALLRYYSFELAGHTLDQQVLRWQATYPEAWLTLAIIEALYQGRYKAISVEQILNLWQRRSQPICHFNGEFERLVCSKLPREVLNSGAPPPVPAPAPAPKPTLSYRRMLLELPSLQAASKLERLNKIPSIPSLKEALATTDLQGLLTDPAEVLGQLTQTGAQPENGLAPGPRNGTTPSPGAPSEENPEGTPGMVGGDRNGTARNGTNSGVASQAAPAEAAPPGAAIAPADPNPQHAPEATTPIPPPPEGEHPERVSLLEPHRVSSPGASPPPAIAPLQVEGYVNPIAAKLAKVQLPIIPPHPPQPPLTPATQRIPPAIAPPRPAPSVPTPVATDTANGTVSPTVSSDRPPTPAAPPGLPPAPASDADTEFRAFKQGVVFALSSGLVSPGLSPQMRWAFHQLWQWDWAGLIATNPQIGSFMPSVAHSEWHDKLKAVAQLEPPAPLPTPECPPPAE